MIRRASLTHIRGHGQMRTYRRAALAAGLALSLIAPAQAQTAAPASAAAGTEAKVFDAKQVAMEINLQSCRRVPVDSR